MCQGPLTHVPVRRWTATALPNAPSTISASSWVGGPTKDTTAGASVWRTARSATWFFSSAARAGAAAEEAYAEARADKIHKTSTDEKIRQSGKTPEEVKAEVDRRIRELKANAAG